MSHPFQRGTCWDSPYWAANALGGFIVLRTYIPVCHQKSNIELWVMDVMLHSGHVRCSLAVPMGPDAEEFTRLF